VKGKARLSYAWDGVRLEKPGITVSPTATGAAVLYCGSENFLGCLLFEISRHRVTPINLNSFGQGGSRDDHPQLVSAFSATSDELFLRGESAQIEQIYSIRSGAFRPWRSKWIPIWCPNAKRTAFIRAAAHGVYVAMAVVR
jgi:hypothetical protein